MRRRNAAAETPLTAAEASPLSFGATSDSALPVPSSRSTPEDSHKHDEKGTARRSARRRWTVERYGIWEVEREASDWRAWLPGNHVVEELDELRASLPYVGRLLKELFARGPLLLIGYGLLSLLRALLPAYALKIRGRIVSLTQRAIDTRDGALEGMILRTFAAQVLLVLVTRLLSWLSHRWSLVLSHRLRRTFDLLLFRARFALDLGSLEDENLARELRIISSPGGRGSDRAWNALQSLVSASSSAIELLTQGTVLFGMLQMPADRTVAALALLKPVLDVLVTHGRYSGNFWARIVDPAAKRLEQLRAISHIPRYRKDILSFVLGPWLTAQYSTASDQVDAVANLSENPHSRQRSPFDPAQLVREIATDLPILYFALQALRAPASMPLSFAAFTLTRQTTSEFSRKAVGLLHQPASLSAQTGYIKQLYDAASWPRLMVDGGIHYERTEPPSGMHVQLRNVSFTYAGGHRPVLRNLSLDIPARALCIVVGENGSGKSTLLKLLSRLYDASEGAVVLSGRDIRAYQIDSLRRCIATLHQDHALMPLSVAENIGMGDSDNADNMEAVRRAADRAGCTSFIEALPNGFATSLAKPDVGTGRVRANRGPASGRGRPAFLRKRADEQERETKLSGGQEQRLALARVLMREETSDLMLFDEPSASLDARTERELFLRTLALRKSKTIVWVSHRLHLCREADIIIYMRDGEIVETGGHADLMARDGQYAELYRFQSL